MGQQPYTIKAAGDGLARQATKAVREAGLVDESSLDDEMGDGRRVVVYGFDGLLIVVDEGRVSQSDRAELVSAAARDTDSIHLGQRAKVTVAGNGYQIYLPGCEAAGLHQEQKTGAMPVDGVVFIYKSGDKDAVRLAEDLAEIRSDQQQG